MKLNINQVSCIKCRKCVRVCPAHIFISTQDSIGLEHIESCIACGHCVAVCPADAVEHETFPPEKLHLVNQPILPGPEQVMELIRSRRSNRAFSSKPVPEEMLSQILEAAHRAPRASNLQQVEFTVITKPETLKIVSDATIEVFGELAKLIGHPLVKPLVKLVNPEIPAMLPQFNRLVEEYRAGNDGILRNATALILIHTPKESRFGCQDANLAYQNASLMAESLGVAQFYTGFVCAGTYNDRKKRLAGALGINGKIQAGIALGMPLFNYPKYMDKKEAKIKYF